MMMMLALRGGLTLWPVGAQAPTQFFGSNELLILINVDINYHYVVSLYLDPLSSWALTRILG